LNWRRWREAVFATCTAWLVLQNVMLFSIVAWTKPENAVAAGREIARTAISMSGPAMMLLMVVVLGLALAAWLVHAPGNPVKERTGEVNHDV
jgi:hypothetical protein